MNLALIATILQMLEGLLPLVVTGVNAISSTAAGLESSTQVKAATDAIVSAHVGADPLAVATAAHIASQVSP